MLWFLFCAVDCVYSLCSYCTGPQLDQQSCPTESCQELAVTRLTKTVKTVCLVVLICLGVLPTNTSILQGEDEEYQLLSGGSEEGEVEWSVSGLVAVYVDLAISYIEFTVKVVKQDETGQCTCRCW